MIGLLNVVLLAVVVFLAFLFLRMEHMDRKIKVVIFVVLGVLIYFSVVNLFNSATVDLTSPKGIIGAVYLYVGWIGRTLANLFDVGKETVQMVGNAISFNVTK